MNSIINFYFLFFVLFIYYLISNKILNYDKLNPEKKEAYSNFSDNNFVNKYANIDTNLYSLTIKDDILSIPILYTNYKYSLEFKFGFELSQIFKIINKESKGLYFNLKDNIDNTNSLLLATESDYIRFINEKNSKKELVNKDNYGFVCSLYPVYFTMISKINLNFNSWNDIVGFSTYLKILELKDKVKSGGLPSRLVIGIPILNSNSFQDAKILFDTIKIDITDKQFKIDTKPEEKNKYLTFVFDTEQNLFNRLKLPDKNNKSINLLYLTTSYKNIYLEEYLRNYDCHIFGTKGLNDVLIKANYKEGVLFKAKLRNKKITNLIVEKNIYDEENYDGNMFISGKEKLIIGEKNSKTYSTRVILLAHKNVDNKYVHYLLRNLYAESENISFKLNKYLLNQERNNTIDDLLDPHFMFYMNQNLNYHKGAHDFYKEINFISTEEDIDENIYTKINNKNLFSKLFITNN